MHTGSYLKLRIFGTDTGKSNPVEKNLDSSETELKRKLVCTLKIKDNTTHFSGNEEKLECVLIP